MILKKVTVFLQDNFFERLKYFKEETKALENKKNFYKIKHRNIMNEKNDGGDLTLSQKKREQELKEKEKNESLRNDDDKANPKISKFEMYKKGSLS